MAQSLITCPLCSAASFSSTNDLCLSLVNVASKLLRCPICEEELRGVDKLTIHLLGHLLHDAEFNRNVCSNSDYLLESTNLVKCNQDQTQDNSNHEQILNNTNPLKSVSSVASVKDVNNRFSLKVDDEVMIFFNSNDNASSSELKNTSQSMQNEHLSTNTSSEFNSHVFKNVCNNIKGGETNIVEQPDDQQPDSSNCSTLNFIKPPSNDNLNYLTVTKMDLSTNHENEETKNVKYPLDDYIQNNNTGHRENSQNSFLSPNGERVFGYRCDICSLVFPNENILLMHQKLIHVELGDNSTKSKHFKCHLCSKMFVMKGSLMVHMRVAHFGGAVVSRLVEAKKLETNTVSPELAQFVCSVCNKGFTKEQQLTQHQMLHESKQCDICFKTFTTKYFLRKHKRLHTGEMPYTCSICSKSFTFQQSYHKHMLYHSDDKPHTCADCGRAFKELSTLHNHQRIHTGEKPFSCDTCGMLFVLFQFITVT